MKRYRIRDALTGADLGVYEAPSPDDAVREMLTDPTFAEPIDPDGLEAFVVEEEDA